MPHGITRMSRWILGGLTSALLLGSAACDDKVDFNVVPIPLGNIAIVSGDAQTGAVGQPLADDLAVRVTDRNGNVVANALVVWVPGSGTVSAASSRTDVNGIATISWSPGVIGSQTLRASIGNGEFVTFTATGT